MVRMGLIEAPSFTRHFGGHPEVGAGPGKTLSPDVEPAV